MVRLEERRPDGSGQSGGMIRLVLPEREEWPSDSDSRLGAHSDDIEIGCGGTVLRLRESEAVEIHWVVLSAAGERGEEARASAEKFAGISTLRSEDLSRRLPSIRRGPGERHVRGIEGRILARPGPHPPPKDEHQDHRLVAS